MAGASVLHEAAVDPRAWTAKSVDDAVHWYQKLPSELLAALRKELQSLPAEKAITELRLAEPLRRRWSELLADSRRDLEEGRGFVILEGLPIDQLSQREAVVSYWLIGQALGEPFAQNVQGTLLYDVRDTGQDVSAGARFSVTNYESSFHTDNSFGDEILDYVGLLCLQEAKSGGISQNVSGYAALAVLQDEHP